MKRLIYMVFHIQIFQQVNLKTTQASLNLIMAELARLNPSEIVAPEFKTGYKNRFRLYLMRLLIFLMKLQNDIIVLKFRLLYLNFHLLKII